MPQQFGQFGIRASFRICRCLRFMSCDCIFVYFGSGPFMLRRFRRFGISIVQNMSLSQVNEMRLHIRILWLAQCRLSSHENDWMPQPDLHDTIFDTPVTSPRRDDACGQASLLIDPSTPFFTLLVLITRPCFLRVECTTIRPIQLGDSTQILPSRHKYSGYQLIPLLDFPCQNFGRSSSFWICLVRPHLRLPCLKGNCHWR